MLPFVSILIPVFNEALYIERCLGSILEQDYPHDQFEVLIADGMSTDNTRSIINKFQSTELSIRIFENPRRLVAPGLNTLIREAKGDILIRVDGHCQIASTYISNCVKHLQRDCVDGVGGSIDTIGEDLTSQVIALAMSSRFGVGGSSFRTEKGQTKLVDTVPFPAYTRKIIDKVGLFDEELVRNQDDEYNYRIRKSGGSILMADDVRSTYYTRGSLGKLWKQYFQYGYWKVRVMQKHPKQMSLRQFVPPVFVLGMIALLIIVAIFKMGWIALIGYMGLYLLVSFTISVPIAFKNACKYFLLLPVAFAILHLSYGSGFILGLVKFWNRWGDKIGKTSL